MGLSRPAVNDPGHAHELTFSCYRHYPFLKAERVCEWLAEAIGDARREHDFLLWAYVFMPEHVHVLVWPKQPQYDIGGILKSIKQPVGVRAIKHLRQHSPLWLPRITVKKGAKTERRFWQAGGGFDRNVTDPRLILLDDRIHPRQSLAAKTRGTS
ncbi:MAG: hypothetical protein FJ303_16925 [Planctomycetes bacterium]|nr:hypothetical protein [Planctomycetota bacterium]